jgi:hypothetical protein
MTPFLFISWVRTSIASPCKFAMLVEEDVSLSLNMTSLKIFVILSDSEGRQKNGCHAEPAEVWAGPERAPSTGSD